VNERLEKMRELGQAPWVDELSREDIKNGGLKRMIEDGILGVTSNPAIFQKAIAGSDLYDEQLAELAERVDDPKQMFWEVARKDIQDASDIFMPVHEETGGRDGFISLEVQPDIAYDTEATVEEATRLHQMVDRPNLFVKIPATLPGLVAIEEMISRGKSINVTLIFSLERYREVARAYTRGLQRLVENGGDPSGVHSVASFFVSRIDSEADTQLQELGAGDRRQTRHSKRQAGLPDLQTSLRRRQVEQARRKGRQQPASALGLDLDQEPRLPRHHLHRQPRRTRHRQHHAQEDHRSRHGPR
jgi:transaldolase